MTIWDSELKDLEKHYSSFKGQDEKLDAELEKLTKATDENMILVYARRCLELVITELCERELKRSRGTDPLKGIIDRLNREEIVPDQIIVSMQNLNNLSTFGAHPKDFDSRQVKPVLIDLMTTLEWYQQHVLKKIAEGNWPKPEQKQVQANVFKVKPTKSGKPGLVVLRLFLALVLVGLVIFVINIVFGEKKIKAGTVDSLMMLPFGNYTGDKQLDYYVDGMYSEMIGNVGKVSGLRVISETTSKSYQSADKSLAEIASELNVDVVIEPTVICLGDSICVQIKAYSMYPEEKLIWVGNYREEKSQILNLYNKVVRQIAGEIKVKLTPREEKLFADARTVNPDAYDAYLKGIFYWNQFTPESFQLALEYFNKAIELDPNWAPPHAGVAYYWLAIRQSGFAPNSTTIPKIYENLDIAYKLDPNSAFTNYVSALVSAWTGFNWEKAEKEFLKALETNPNDALCRNYYSQLLMILKRDAEAIKQADIALDLDPLNPMILALSSMVYGYLGEYDKAIKVGHKALDIVPNHGVALGNISTGYLYKKDFKNAFKYTMKYYGFDEKTSKIVLQMIDEKGYKAAANRLAGEIEKVDYKIPVDVGQMYAIAGNQSMAMDWFELSFNEHNANTPYLGLSWFTKGPFMIEDPRFVELLKKLNLPIK